MRFDIITLFPELFAPFLASGVTRRAYASGQVDVPLWNPRDHADEDVQRGCVCLLRPDRSWQQQADRAEPDQDAQASIAGRSGFT